MSRFGVFGGWDAPAVEGLPEIPPPLGERCVYCHEEIADGDAGAITPSMGVHHRECSYRSVMGGIGHYVDHGRYCRGELGPDAGLSRRQSALLVWRHLVDGDPVTEATLTLARRG